MKLDPSDYTCPDHGTDLTGQVKQALKEDGPPVVYLRVSLPGSPARPRPFEVIVTCPGDGGPTHQLTCSGIYAQ